MTTAAQKPVIEVIDIRPGSKKNGVQNVSVGLQKFIPAEAAGDGKSLSNLSLRRSGDDRMVGARDKKLVTYINMTQKGCELMGIVEGVDINTLGHDVFYDIREIYSTELTGVQEGTLEHEGKAFNFMQRSGLDQDGNVQLSPVINPVTNTIPLSNGKPLFRNIQLLMGESLNFPKSVAKPNYDRTEDGTTASKPDFPEAKKTVVDEKSGKNRKTPEYQDFLNKTYAGEVTVAFAEEVEA